MLPAFFDFVLSRPRLTRSLGEALCWVGSTGLLAGFIASSINRILEVRSSRGGGSTPLTFSQLFPPLPTWWVPESLLAVLFYASLIPAGYVFLECSRRLRRLMAGSASQSW